MKKKVIFTAGGTGGHLFPAQVTADELKEYDILFVAGSLSKSRYFDTTRFAFEEIEAATFGFSNPFKLLNGTFKISKGVVKSLKIFKDFSPDLVVGFGSFFTLPVLTAALLKKIPIILHEQNAIPGKVNRLFSRFSLATAFTFPESQQLLKGNLIETQFPLRKKNAQHDVIFGLDHQKPILLVFGGSQGAHKLNKLLLDAAKYLKDFQIMHFTGSEQATREAIEAYEKENIKHYVKAFEPNIHLAMECADIVVCRSGASTLAELIEYEKPALLIPFPFASENHQVNNATHFMREVQGGDMCIEKELDLRKFLSLIESLFHNRFEKKKKIQDYKIKKQLRTLPQLIRDILKHE